jgi:hybrid polyketide synthase/nonribosomal peptide synthetase ACE1
LTALDGAFASYTCTDPAADRAEQIKQSLNLHENKFIARVLDIEKDLAQQGYTEHSFDLIVASLATQAHTKPREIVENIQKLLRPGGYLLLLEVEVVGHKDSESPFDESSCYTFDQSPSPCDNVTDWRKLLEASGFADVETIADDTGHLRKAVHVVFGQAIDDRIKFLRNPLASVAGNIRDCSVTFVGGATVASARCLTEMTKILEGCSGKIIQTKDLETVAKVGLPLGGTVVCLQDHDNFVFDAIDEGKLKGLQELFGKSRNILWVARDYRLGSPYAKMMVAFARCVLQELPHVQLQILDLASSDKLDTTIISEHLLRLLVTEQWRDLGQLDGLLWSLEPEVSHHGGQALIPRVQLSKHRNDCYNSARRQITENIDQSVLPVTLSVYDHGYTLKSKSGQVQNALACKTDYAKVSVRVSYSYLKAVKLGSFGYFHLIVGFDSVSGEQIIALSTSLSSEVDVPLELTRSCSQPKENVAGYLTAFFYSLLTIATLENLGCGDSLLVLEPDEDFADALWHTATARGVEVRFFTAGNKRENQGIWKSLHPRPSRKDVHAVLPHRLTRVLCWQQNHWTSAVCGQLPHGTVIELPESYTALKATALHSGAIGSISDIFDRAQSPLPSTLTLARFQGVCAVPLTEVHKLSTSTSLVTVVDWLSSPTVPITLDPVDKAALFRNDVSYWLVGLTGGLGLSLCEWMVSRGARHIAISSRNPQIDPRWKAHWKSLDATVNVYANDVTDREAVRSLYAKIQADMPPVAGVCQGAMVLQDTLLQNLNLERVEKVQKPKVDGALNLDEVFRHQKLDFFVMLSSIAAVLGNPGQAAYAAANGFLAGLATERRARGVAASTVNIGAIAGIGYVTRELTQAQQTGLQKAGAVFMSEQDFHQAFAEAVIASPPDQTSSYEFNTGLRVCYADEVDIPKYVSNPVFAHLLLHRDVPGTAQIGTIATATVKLQLLEASTVEEIHVILKGMI